MQFGVYRLPRGQLVIDLQAEAVTIPSRVVAPLRPPARLTPPFAYLEPVVEVNGAPHVVHVAEMLAVRSGDLVGPPIADLGDRRNEIIRALDMLFTGV